MGLTSKQTHSHGGTVDNKPGVEALAANEGIIWILLVPLNNYLQRRWLVIAVYLHNSPIGSFNIHTTINQILL